MLNKGIVPHYCTYVQGGYSGPHPLYPVSLHTHRYTHRYAHAQIHARRGPDALSQLEGFALGHRTAVLHGGVAQLTGVAAPGHLVLIVSVPSPSVPQV